jgi:hypothetical protein
MRSLIDIGRAKMTWFLIDTGGATTLEPRNNHDLLSTLPFKVLHFSLFALPGHTI